MSSAIVYIYAMRCPFTDDIRYVGKSINPKRRYREHLQKAKSAGRKWPVASWIAALLAKNEFPLMTILNEVGEQEWEDEERYWIAKFRAEKCRLLNLTDGGEGHHNPSAEARVKMGANRGRTFSAQARANMGKSHIGRKVSAKTIDALIFRNKNIPFSEERKRRIGAAQKGKKISEAHRAALSGAHKGVKKSEEMLRKRSATIATVEGKKTERIAGLLAEGLSLKKIFDSGYSLRAIGKATGTNHHSVKSRIQQCV
jgi:hypothetical protein